jgi:hypothetical protein
MPGFYPAGAARARALKIRAGNLPILDGAWQIRSEILRGVGARNSCGWGW